MNPEFRSTVTGAGALSPDGYFYWDGVQWKAAISADGAWRWNGAAWAPTGQSRIGSYASARTLGVWVCILLGLCVVVAFIQVFVFDPYFQGWLALGDQRVNYTVDFAGLLNLLITSALFVVWFHRAYQNAAALGAADLQFSSGWAVGWWFVPIACFWMPYRAAVDIWKASGSVALATTHGQARRTDAAPTLVSVWWVTWLLCLALVNVAAVLANPDNGLDLLTVVSNALTVLAAVLAIIVVMSVSKRQDARWRQLASMTPSYGTASSEVGQ
jgi:small-conductance mechanosensitive channel